MKKEEMRTSNIQRSTSNAQRGGGPKYDLEERLLDYAANIIRVSNSLPADKSGAHVAGQLLRSGTSALSNHGEAQAAESPADFVHKMSICLKELRESFRWLRLIARVPMVTDSAPITGLIAESDELIAIFVSSIRTAERRLPRPRNSDSVGR